MYVAMFNVTLVGEYCFKPEDRVLKNIRWEFGAKWKYVGCELGIKVTVIDTIELNEKCVEDQAFKMLCNWRQRDKQPCYCKLIAAMETESLNSGVDCLKEWIKRGRYRLVINCNMCIFINIFSKYKLKLMY